MIRTHNIQSTLIKSIAIVIIALLIGTRYWNSAYVWDDAEIFNHLSQTPWTALWAESVTGGRLGAAYYRPFAMSTIKFCGEPFRVHILITLLHALSALAIFRLAPKAFGVALLFVVHPLAGEVLGWASALPDALAVCAGLWSVCAAKKSRWSLVFLLLLIGVFSKETALVPLFGYLLSTLRGLVKNRRGWWVLFVVFGIAMGLRLWAGAVGGDLNFTSKLAFAPKAFFWGIGSLLWPFPLSVIHDIHVLPVERLLFGAVGCFLCLWACAYSRYRAQTITILLSIGLAVPTMIDGGLLAERYVYMAVAGACWGIGSLPGRRLQKWTRQGVVTTILFVIVLILGLRIHSARALDWHSDRSLFESAVQSFPNSSFAHHFTGIVALRENRMESAAGAFEAALHYSYAHTDDRHLYMLSLVESKQYARAYQYAQSGPKDNLDAIFIAYWGKAAFHLGQTEQARELLSIICEGRNRCDGPDWVQELYVTGLQ